MMIDKIINNYNFKQKKSELYIIHNPSNFQYKIFSEKQKIVYYARNVFLTAYCLLLKILAIMSIK